MAYSGISTFCCRYRCNAFAWRYIGFYGNTFSLGQTYKASRQVGGKVANFDKKRILLIALGMPLQVLTDAKRTRKNKQWIKMKTDIPVVLLAV